MSSSVTQRMRFALLPVAAVVVIACGSAASTGFTETVPDASTGTTDTTETTTSESSLAPAGARAFYTFDQSGGGLVRVDPDNGQIDEVLEVPGSVYAMDQAAGHLWLGTDTGSVLRVDPTAASTVAEIAAPSSEGLFDLSAGDDGTWVLYGIPGAGTSLVKIDAASNTAGEPIAAAEGLSFFDVEAGDGVWLVGSSPEMATTLYAVDPATGELTDQKIQMVVDAIDSGDGAVWLAGSIFPDGMTGVPGVAKFDPATKELTTVEIPAEAGSIAIGSGGVWAASGIGEEGTTLYRIDPATGTLAATIPLGDAEGGRVKVSTGAGAVWVTTDGGATYVVDPATDTVAGGGDSMGTLGMFFPES